MVMEQFCTLIVVEVTQIDQEEDEESEECPVSISKSEGSRLGLYISSL